MTKQKKTMMLIKTRTFYLCSLLALAGLLFFLPVAQAQNISDVAGNLISTISNVDQLLVAIAYIVGIGYALSAIIKFKNHKENPQQVPLSMPVIELCVALSLIFLPTLIPIFEQTLLEGSDSDGNYQATTNLPSFSEINPNESRTNSNTNPTYSSATNASTAGGMPQTFEHNGQLFVLDNNNGHYIPVAQPSPPPQNPSSAANQNGNPNLRTELEGQLTTEQQALLEAYIHSRGQ